MPKIKLAKATDEQLNWLVTEIFFYMAANKQVHVKTWVLDAHRKGETKGNPYVTDALWAWPIIEQNFWCIPRMNTNPGALHLGQFAASTPGGIDYYGDSSFRASMRAYIATYMGNEPEVPEGV